MVSTTILGSFNIGQTTLLGDVDGDGDQETLAEIFSEDSENGAELSEAERAILTTYVASELYGIINDPSVIGLADDIMSIVSALEQLGSDGLETIGELKVDIYEIKGSAKEIEDEIEKLNDEAQALINDALTSTDLPYVPPMTETPSNSLIPTETLFATLSPAENPPPS